MALIHLRNISLAFGGPPLIADANLSINKGEKLCIIGRNGVGKSTLLKAIAGLIDVDAGAIEKAQAVVVAMMPQTIEHLSGTVFSLVKNILVDQQVEPWKIDHQVSAILSKLELNGDQDFSALSGGLKRRVLLAQALVQDPDVLLLDEPTNHLDIDMILWLENFLKNYQKTLIFITHDRSLMQNVANVIVEVDHGQLYRWAGRYQDYLQFKQTEEAARSRHEALFDKKLAEEEAWIRQGIKARRTRNEGRVRALEAMRKERSQRRAQLGKVKITQQNTEISGKLVFEIENLTFSYDQQIMVNNFSTIILRGDKIGIIGANGSGKTTLLNLILGKLEPTAGEIKHGTNLSIGYFDQQHRQLHLQQTVMQNVVEGSEYLTINGEKKHVMSYLQDFLFPPARARTPVTALSGGERNRLLLAKLFSKPHNVLVLDEPTNDLDIETLELLEEQLINYQGTLLLISHDRTFLNNIVTSTLVMEGHGHIGEYVGGYDDWLRQRKSTPVARDGETANINKKPKATVVNKLTNEEMRELKRLPEQIEKLEVKKADIESQLSDPNLYQQHHERYLELNKILQDIDDKIMHAFNRWQALEEKNNGAN